MKDFYQNVVHDQVIDPDTITADTDGSSVDLLGYDRVVFYALIGESGDTLSGSVKIELEVEESADDSSFTDVADAHLTKYVAGTNDGCFALIDAAAEDDAVYMTEYRGSKRYVRPVINVTGTHSNGTPMGIVALRIGPARAAVTQT
jgi:hypothetical protein